MDICTYVSGCFSKIRILQFGCKAQDEVGCRILGPMPIPGLLSSPSENKSIYFSGLVVT